MVVAEAASRVMRSVTVEDALVPSGQVGLGRGRSWPVVVGRSRSMGDDEE